MFICLCDDKLCSNYLNIETVLDPSGRIHKIIIIVYFFHLTMIFGIKVNSPKDYNNITNQFL
jgi:hypothetical protein